MTYAFNNRGRAQALADMAAEPVDLLVVGGGITGCGIARAAALRGNLRVGLVERTDFGAGTSSRSSKLIHGGLRYLAYGDLRLVRESLRECQMLSRIAPQLVRPLPFLFPLWPDQSALKYRLGFQVYEWLGGGSYAFLTPQAVAERVPDLRQPVAGGFAYTERSTDDARLTLANAMSAAEHGALVANHAALTAWDPYRQKATVFDGISGASYRIKARVVVNATGPWAEKTRANGPSRLLLSKGIHIVFPADRLPVEGAVVLRSPAGQEGFAIRRDDLVYIGTTDVVHTGPPDQPIADPQAVDNLLGLARSCFPGLRLERAEIIGTWAGLRPLITQPGRAPRDTSRHDEIWHGPAGMITIAGGKLTTYRAMANRVMRHVERSLRLPADEPERTAVTPLPPIPFRQTDPHRAVTHEMALTLSDYLDRRSGQLLFSRDHGQELAENVSHTLAELLNWTEHERTSQVAEYLTTAQSHHATSA